MWVFKNLERSDVYMKRALEVGSFDVNGSPRTVIERLKPAEYVGVDITEGKGVDIICKCEDLVEKFGKESFDLVISTCTLEHIEDWRKSISNIKQVCKPNGLIIIIVPSKWPYHDYPHDYWRYSKDDLVRIFSDCKILKLDSDLVSGRDPNGNITSLSLVYIKCRKPENFEEVDLSEYEVSSVEGVK
jgi:SAM-dependent methyltransferase